jgi:hypothetical protein
MKIQARGETKQMHLGARGRTVSAPFRIMPLYTNVGKNKLNTIFMRKFQQNNHTEVKRILF